MVWRGLKSDVENGVYLHKKDHGNDIANPRNVFFFFQFF